MCIVNTLAVTVAADEVLVPSLQKKGTCCATAPHAPIKGYVNYLRKRLTHVTQVGEEFCSGCSTARLPDDLTTFSSSKIVLGNESLGPQKLGCFPSENLSHSQECCRSLLRWCASRSRVWIAENKCTTQFYRCYTRTSANVRNILSVPYRINSCFIVGKQTPLLILIFTTPIPQIGISLNLLYSIFIASKLNDRSKSVSALPRIYKLCTMMGHFCYDLLREDVFVGVGTSRFAQNDMELVRQKEGNLLHLTFCSQSI